MESVLALNHVDEPQALQEYADVLSRVAADRQPIVVRRDGADLAAVVPLEYLHLLQDVVARHQAEQLAAHLDWERLVRISPPQQSWFDEDEPQPF